MLTRLYPIAAALFAVLLFAGCGSEPSGRSSAESPDSTETGPTPPANGAKATTGALADIELRRVARSGKLGPVEQVLLSCPAVNYHDACHELQRLASDPQPKRPACRQPRGEQVTVHAVVDRRATSISTRASCPQAADLVHLGAVAKTGAPALSEGQVTSQLGVRPYRGPGRSLVYQLREGAAVVGFDAAAKADELTLKR